MTRIVLIDHCCQDSGQLVDYGRTERGTRILINRDVIAADVRIAIGNIVPHHPTGWSAGAKAVLPGVAGEETVAQMHLLGCRYPSLGQVVTPVRQEMEDLAEKIGLSFILNVILNHDGHLVAAIAGHFVQAHRAGVEIAQTVYGVDIPARADLVISSTWPVDCDLFQADKGIASAELAVKAGGEVLLVAACAEGISPAHPQLAAFLGRMTNDEIWALLSRHQVADPLAAAEGIMLNDSKSRVRITVSSDGLGPDVCLALGFGHVWPARLSEYVEQRLREQPNMMFGILLHSATVLPMPKA